MDTQQDDPLRPLILHLVNKDDKQALWLLVDHLSQIEPRPQAQLFPGAVGREVIKHLAPLDREKRKRAEPQTIQPQLAMALWKHEPELPSNGPVIKELLDMGLGQTVLGIKRAAQWSEADVLDMAPMLLNTPIQRLLEALPDWAEDQQLNACGQAARQIHMETGWLAKDVNSSTMTVLREGRSWQPDEAERYLRDRLWPDWKGRQYSSKHLDYPCSDKFSTDKRALVEKIPAQAWQQVVLDAPYDPKLTEIFLGIAERLGNKLHRMDLPLPGREWITRDIECMANTTHNGVKSWCEFMGARCLGAAKNEGGFAWSRIADSLAYYGRAKGTNRIHQDVLSHLGKLWTDTPQAGPPDPLDASYAQAKADGAWIATSPLDALEQHLPAWLDAQQDTTMGEGYHTHLAYTALARLRKEGIKDPDLRCPALARCYWTQFLRAARDEKNKPTKVLSELINEQAPGHGALWNFGPDAFIQDLVRNGEVAKQRMNGDNQKLWHGILLQIQVETQPRVGREYDRKRRM